MVRRQQRLSRRFRRTRWLSWPPSPAPCLHHLPTMTVLCHGLPPRPTDPVTAVRNPDRQRSSAGAGRRLAARRAGFAQLIAPAQAPVLGPLPVRPGLSLCAAFRPLRAGGSPPAPLGGKRGTIDAEAVLSIGTGRTRIVPPGHRHVWACVWQARWGRSAVPPEFAQGLRPSTSRSSLAALPVIPARGGASVRCPRTAPRPAVR